MDLMSYKCNQFDKKNVKAFIGKTIYGKFFLFLDIDLK